MIYHGTCNPLYMRVVVSISARLIERQVAVRVLAHLAGFPPPPPVSHASRRHVS
jgi:hypothetical protein